MISLRANLFNILLHKRVRNAKTSAAADENAKYEIVRNYCRRSLSISSLVPPPRRIRPRPSFC